MSISRFQLHKSVHINITKDTHANFRINLFKRGLSMQEVFEALAVAIVENDPYLTKMLDKLEYNKKHKISVKKVNSTDAESIFEAIEESNPLLETIEE
jgi:predicted nuclease with RNAse H fold|tara:strand:+ start:127 stop:420 length:294 start_codon:yes stop_codon:yes gene_type:complete